MAGKYVKAVYDFRTSESGEICLTVGDIVEVVRQIDDNWLCGKLHGQTGNFPASFAAPLSLPVVQAGQKLFAATRSFPAEVQGDLGLKKGDIIVGLQAVDTNWWQGQTGNTAGIFPITHVIELDVPTPARPVAVPPLPLGGAHVPGAPQVQDDTKRSGGVDAKVRATMDLTAQLDDELSFSVGDIITVTKIIDADFGIGECNGKVGQFPIAFVEVIEGNLNLDALHGESRKSKCRWWVEEDAPSNQHKQGSTISSQSSVIPSATPAPSSGQNYDGGNYSETHSSYAAGSIPDPVHPVSNEVKTHRRVNSYTQANTRSYDSDITPYAKTLYPFIAENPNELTFFDNEIVNLIRHVDEQWMEGEMDGKRGIFPRAYVEIIVDCPYADDIQITPQPAEPSQSAEAQEQPGNDLHNEKFSQSVEPAVQPEEDAEMYALVLYDFKSETDQSLSLYEGDTVTVLRKLDEHWCEAKHDDGRVGLCPLSYVRVIDMEPPDSKSISTSAADTNSAPPSYESVVGETKPRDNEPSVNDLPGSAPEVGKPVRPLMKPKPQLKPKPGARAKSTCSSPSPSSLQTAESVSKPACPPRRTMSLDVNSSASESSLGNQKPVVSVRKLPPTKPPSFQKANTIDTTLDALIAHEMQVFKTGPNESSLGPAGEPTSRTDPSLDPNNQSGISRTSSGKAVGSSKFYAPVKTPTDEAPPGLATRGRPTPGRPPPPPPINSQLQRASSGKRAPPRPTGPRAAAAPSRTPLAPTQVDYGPKPVPARPAPARPNPNRPRPTGRMANNLMDFSPEKQSQGLSEQDQEVVADLDRHILEIERDLEKCMQSRQELEHMLTVVDGAERLEAEDNLEFYNANIQGLGQEMQQLKTSVYKLQPERARAEAEAAHRAAEAQRRAEEERRQADMEKQEREELRQKRRDKRERVVAEIVQTERDYLQSLSLLLDVCLRPDAPKCPSVDLETLLGNVEEVVEVSQKLLTQLEGATSGRDFDKQIIGTTFLNVKEDMKKVYAPYCRNHDDAIALLEKYEENAEVQEYFTQMMDMMRQKMTVFDIGSVLIKPVQRVLKYPLLLNELIKATEEDHVDRQQLQNAMNAMTDVAATINEYKRRKDLVLKYRTDRGVTMTEKIARLSVHSTKKKLSRITQRMVGIQTVDETFNKEERRFTALDKAVRSLVRDIAVFIDQLHEAVGSQESVANDISDYYSEKSGQQEVEQFCTVRNVIASHLFYAFRFEVEGEVITPLNRLLMMFAGPVKVIKKRHDKLLDYDNAQGKVKSIRDAEQLKVAQQDLQRTKNNYEALNAQLLDELPRLYALSVDVAMECIARLIQAQQTFHQKALDQMYQLLALPMILGSDQDKIIESFNIAHTTVVEVLSSVSCIPKTFNPRLEEHRPSKSTRRVSGLPAETQELEASTQSDGQRVYLTQIYSTDRLFRLLVHAASGQPMDLVAPAGTIVGVIKEGDPMGNKERWFVDTGAVKGFVMKKMLGPYNAASPVPGPQTSPQPAQAASAASSKPPATDLMDLSSPKSPEGPAKATPIPLDLDFSPLPEVHGTMSEKLPIDQPPERLQTIDWGIPANPQPNTQPLETLDQSATASLPEQGEPSPPPSYTEYDPSPGATPQVTDGAGICYRAVYSFTARSPIEASMEEGQLVEVLQQHDLDGNSEWWLIKANGQEGYAPASYLYQVQ